MATQLQPASDAGTPVFRVPHVVIVGGGFGGLAAARALGGEAARVTICDRLNYHLFQPLLYQVALASLSPSDIAVPIRAAVREHRNIDVVLAEVTGIDLDRRRLQLADGNTLDYDYLVLAAGARTHYHGHDDWAAYAPGIKDLDDALEVRRRVLSTFEAAERATDADERRRLLTFVIIGGGPTGVELAGAIADLSRDILQRDFRHVRHEDTKVVLIEMADRILLPFDPGLAEKAHEQLRELGVEIRTGVRVSRIDGRGVWLGDALVPSATVLWGAGVVASSLAGLLDLPLDRSGRVAVGQDCSIAGQPNVFAIGDMAAFTPIGAERALPGISPVAMQQGRCVAANILRDGHGGARQPFSYVDKGFMATIGRARAIAVLGKLRLSGLVAWLVWVFVHLWFLIGFRNRVVVFTNWIWAYLMAKYGSRLITGRRPAGPKQE